MNLLNFLTFIPLAIGLFVSIRHRKISSFMPLLTAGLGLLLFSSWFSMLRMFFITYFLNHSYYPIPQWIYLVTTLIYVVGWTIFGAGLGLVLKDVSEKLAFWEEASQNGWRFGANGVRHQENRTEMLEGTEGLEDLLQEEMHRSAFIAPVAQAYNFQPYPIAHAEQPEVIVPLGSSNF